MFLKIVIFDIALLHPPSLLSDFDGLPYPGLSGTHLFFIKMTEKDVKETR